MAKKQSARPTPPLPPPAVAQLRPVVVDAALFQQVLALAVAGALVWSVRGVLVPLLFVGVLTFLGAPVVARLQLRGLPRFLGAGVVVGGGVLAVVALVMLVVPALVNDLAALATRLPALVVTATQFLESHFHVSIPARLSEFSGAAFSELVSDLKPLAAVSTSAVSSTVATTVNTGVGVLRGAASAFGVLVQMALVPVLSYFTLAEWPQVDRLLSSLVPAGAHATLAHYRPLVGDALSRLFRGQIIVAGIMSALYVVGLSIAGVPLALAVGILSGAAYLVPFASAGVALALSVALAVLELGANAGTPVLGAAVVCIAVQLIEGYLLTPRIVGEQAGLSPLAALLAVLLGGAAAGFLGVLFALPAACVIALVLKEEGRRREGAASPASTLGAS